MSAIPAASAVHGDEKTAASPPPPLLLLLDPLPEPLLDPPELLLDPPLELLLEASLPASPPFDELEHAPADARAVPETMATTKSSTFLDMKSPRARVYGPDDR